MKQFMLCVFLFLVSPATTFSYQVEDYLLSLGEDSLKQDQLRDSSGYFKKVLSLNRTRLQAELGLRQVQKKRVSKTLELYSQARR
ncbi:MAG: hypothetical protein PHV17_01310 [Candidatus Omnitrophica bacterium]|nr:hypothetical protein [Candidatus Omnitrophota bacterium]